MKPGQGKTNVPPHALLDEVKAGLGISSDRDLAKELGVLPSAISKIRKKKVMSGEVQIKIHKRTKWTFYEIEELLAEATK